MRRACGEFLHRGQARLHEARLHEKLRFEKLWLEKMRQDSMRRPALANWASNVRVVSSTRALFSSSASVLSVRVALKAVISWPAVKIITRLERPRRTEARRRLRAWSSSGSCDELCVPAIVGREITLVSSATRKVMSAARWTGIASPSYAPSTAAHQNLAFRA